MTDNTVPVFAYQNEYDFCCKIAQTAGAMIKDAFHKPKNIDLKSGVADLVTETDKGVEEFLINTIKAEFTGHCFIGEESTAAGGDQKVEITDAPTWVIDPVDGTTNFVHSFPFTAVCIGFMANKITEFGIVYNPIREEFFAARKGFGATLNGEKITVSPSSSKTVQGAMIITEIGSSREKERVDYVFSNLRKTLDAGARAIRSMGSAALNICSVACGRADAFYEAGMHIWDICASGLIAREAGGVTIDIGGGEFDLCSRRIIVAASPELAQNLSGAIDSIELERD